MKLMKRPIALSLITLLAAFMPVLAFISPQDAVNQFVSHSSLRYASVGVNVIDLDSAKSIANYEDGDLVGSAGIAGAALPL